MNWFKKLFSESSNGRSLPPITQNSHPAVPEVKPNKDISEPVYSFVECVKSNPKRFVAEVQDSEPYGDYCYYRVFSIEDKNTQEKWDTLIAGCSRLNVVSKPDFLTEDEVVYVVNELEVVYKYRAIKKARILKNRAKRVHEKERKRLLEIYK